MDAALVEVSLHTEGLAWSVYWPVTTMSPTKVAELCEGAISGVKRGKCMTCPTVNVFKATQQCGLQMFVLNWARGAT